MRRWRLLVDGPASGEWNMGVDEALLASAACGGPPTLRFYTWDGPWLSLGYGQPDDPVRLAACEAGGVRVVHRATGGRAVLHGADLTYALAAPEALLPAGLQASYQRVGEGLLAALRALGVEAVKSRPDAAGPARGEFDCFGAPAAHELCAAGRKLVGSAQRRARGGVLQHGSIRFDPDSESARRPAGLEPEAATSLTEQGFRGPLEAVIDACARALARTLDADLEPGSLSGPELEMASRPRGVRR